MASYTKIRIEGYSAVIQQGRRRHRVDLAEPAAKPFLKWTGGKQWLAPLARLLPPPRFSGTYYEPFLGGGALFFSLSPERAVLADVSTALIDTYRAIKKDAERVVTLLAGYPHDPNFYGYMRTAKPRALHTIASRMIYLNKTAFNGIYRVNRQGEFNVPFGRYTNPAICQPDRLMAAAGALRGARLVERDFEAATSKAQKGDLVYFDPPYITGHTNNGFLKYNASLFAWGDQERLARVAKQLADRGVYVLVSNANHDSVVNHYEGFYRYVLQRKSMIGGRGSSRGLVSEALLSSYPLAGWKTARI
jgi:DNA adenine methylase